LRIVGATMAKGNGKNGNGHKGNGNSANGVKSGRGVASPKEPIWAVTEPEESAPAIVVPPRGLTPLVVGAAALALGGGAVYAVHRWRQQQRTALDPATPEDEPGASTPASGAPSAEAPSSEAPAAPGLWGTTKRGEVYRLTFARWALGSMAIAEGVAAWSRFDTRTRLFMEAAQRARSLQRTLVVIGDPDAGLSTRLRRA